MSISGKKFRDAVISGANNILNQKVEIDELNVFPVPDGDTGTNMSMTIKGALAELKVMPDDVNISTVADAVASAMLRSARGNSGVILSLLFRGLSRGLSGKKSANVKEYSAALKLGVDAAYKSVMKPTEGTILTVAREAAEEVEKYAVNGTDVTEMFDILVKTAEESLERTPELLPVLKKAGVVDAGGAGYIAILKGMQAVLDGGEIVEGKSADSKVVAPVFTNAAGEFETDIEFTYCTEYIVVKAADARDAKALRAYLETIGDSVVVVDDDEIIKVHVHTEHPGKALEEGLLFGSLTNLKIENMKEQHKGQAIKAEIQKNPKLATARPEEKFGFVAVASGSGLEALFADLGVNSIVRGGQTNNPSTEDILEAVLATPAKNVFVLPNNKNIIMAAEQTIKLATDRNVIVLQSRTVPQGISAMLSFDPEKGVSENSVAMTKALDKVSTGSVTFAVRDSDFEGKNIKTGDILGMDNGKLAVVEKDVDKALIKVLRRLIKTDTQYITLFYGSDVNEDKAEEMYNYVKSKVNANIEVSLVNGGQPIYYYIASVE